TSTFLLLDCSQFTRSDAFRFYLRFFSIFSFFSNRPSDHPDVHSFPTRRSSDPAPILPRPDQPFYASRLCPQVRHSRGRELGNPRSEEHTSELQSRFDLVCRLLLEKKKER